MKFLSLSNLNAFSKNNQLFSLYFLYSLFFFYFYFFFDYPNFIFFSLPLFHYFVDKKNLNIIIIVAIFIAVNFVSSLVSSSTDQMIIDLHFDGPLACFHYCTTQNVHSRNSSSSSRTILLHQFRVTVTSITIVVTMRINDNYQHQHQ